MPLILHEELEPLGVAWKGEGGGGGGSPGALADGGVARAGAALVAGGAGCAVAVAAAVDSPNMVAVARAARVGQRKLAGAVDAVCKARSVRARPCGAYDAEREEHALHGGPAGLQAIGARNVEAHAQAHEVSEPKQSRPLQQVDGHAAG